MPSGAEQIFVNCTNGGPIRVHVQDGRITRVRPLVFDDTDAASWKLEVDGEEYTPLRKACVAPFALTERARVYSEDRILYPMKRVDFDPKGERNPQNRGRSGYVRIGWDEALEIVSSEMKRIRADYGPEAIMSRAGSHHNWGNLGYRTGAWSRFFNLIGFTDIFDNPDSWEGWHWGATHAWGFYLETGQSRALRHARGRPQAHRVDHPLGQRSRFHPRHLWRERVRPVASLAQEAGQEADHHRPLLTTTRVPPWATNGSPTDRARPRRWPWPSPTCG